MKRTRTNAHAVSQRMRERILSGDWKPGQLIPGRRDLAKEYQAALTTIERSAATLISEGLLRVDGRRCTYVAEEIANFGFAHHESTATGDLKGTVGLVAALVSYPSEQMRREFWYARMLAACEQVLADHGDLHQVCVNLTPSGLPDLTASEAVAALLDEPISAAVVMGEGEIHVEIIDRLARAGIRVVSASQGSSQGRTPEVCSDDVVSGRLAARHLVDRGCSQLIYLSPFTAHWVSMRLSGIRQGAGDTPVRVFPEGLIDTPPEDGSGQMRAGMAAAMTLLGEGLAPRTGIITPNDAVASAFMRVASHAGLIAGKDYAIVGFDDRERGLGLTSMRPQLEPIGEEAGRMVLKLLAGEPCAPRIIIPNRLIPRSSTRCSFADVATGQKPEGQLP
jgi:DNA-binding LacI/PurR family transcriptional regulator